MSAVASITSVSALEAIKQPRHRWYFVKEAFSPELVQRAIADAQCTASDLVFDPFCGSGTVPLVATLAGVRAAGIEINPFLAFVSRAKAMKCRPDTVEALASQIRAPIRRGRPSPFMGFSTFSKSPQRTKWLFNEPVLRSFEGGWYSSAGHHDAGAIVRLCLIGAAMDSSNAVKDGKCLRYRSDWRDQAFDANTFEDAFEKRVIQVVEDLRKCHIHGPSPAIELADSRRLSGRQQFKLCVTSPPYLNSFDYTDVYRPELFLGRWIKNMAQLRELRQRTVRSHVQVKWERPSEREFGSHYEEIEQRLNAERETLWDNRIPLMVQAYFEDMRNVLKRLRGKAAEKASCWIVVSTSSYAGIEIPVDLILADIASKVGWYLREVSVVRYLDRVAGQQWGSLSLAKANRPHLRESVIVLDATPP